MEVQSIIYIVMYGVALLALAGYGYRKSEISDSEFDRMIEEFKKKGCV